MRHFRKIIPLALFLALPAPAFSRDGDSNTTPALRVFDDIMEETMQTLEIPGASLTIIKDGHILYAKGFGLANVEKKKAVQPDSVFRIASLSKCITAAAIMQLVEKRRFELSDPAFSILKLKPFLEKGARVDPRLAKITVEDLLRHRAGWDEKAPDAPRWGPLTAQRLMGLNQLATTAEEVSLMMGKPLAFDPGTKMVYSNFGYLVLGRIVEAVSGMNYGDYVRQNILLPLGMKETNLARTAETDRLPKEVTYYDADATLGPAPFGSDKGKAVRAPYRYNYLEALESFGGWASSGSDLARFAAAFDDPDHCKILSAKSIETMWTPPSVIRHDEEKNRRSSLYYGLGWFIRKDGEGRIDAHHTGRIPGTGALISLHHNGIHWVVLMNKPTSAKSLGSYTATLNDRLKEAADAITAWPTETSAN